MTETSEAARKRTTHGTVRDVLEAGNESAFGRYRRLTFADAGIGRFILFELATMFLLPLPGALGLLARRKLLKYFFGSFGRNVIVGRNCVFRHPNRIHLGDNVTIDDDCLLDARGCHEHGMRIGDGVILSRGCTIKSKLGDIRIGRGVNIGGATQIISHSGVTIGDHAAIAGGCRLDGGTFELEDFAKPPPERAPASHGPIEIGDGCWLATNVVVLDAAQVGAGAIVSAGSVITQSVEPRTIVQGNPARKIFTIR